MPQLKIFSGRSNRPLAEKIAHHLGEPLGKLEIQNFSDGEIWVKSLTMCAAPIYSLYSLQFRRLKI